MVHSPDGVNLRRWYDARSVGNRLAKAG